jgi:hypothetical protein
MTNLSNPPTIEPTDDWLNTHRAHLLRALETDAPARRRIRLTWRLAVIALAVLLLAGAAIAATGYTLFDWLHTENPGEARFSIDTSRTVEWPAPGALACDGPGTGEFSCAPGGTGPWVYELYDRVATPDTGFTRESLLAAIDDEERRGAMSSQTAEELRGQIAAVGDEFFEKMSILFRISNISSPHEVRPGVVVVPPEDVPQFVTCRPNGAAYRCANLAESVDIPIGAPIYGLRENSKWIEQPYRPQPPDLRTIVESAFGRALSPAEERLLITLGTAVGGGSKSTGGGVEGETTSG